MHIEGQRTAIDAQSAAPLLVLAADLEEQVRATIRVVDGQVAKP
jgi:hypothetical protein